MRIIRILAILLIIFSVFFKYVEIHSLNLGIYLLISVLSLLSVLLISPTSLQIIFYPFHSNIFKYFFLFVIVITISPLFTKYTYNVKQLLIYYSALIVFYTSIVVFLKTRPPLNKIINIFIVFSIISSIFVIIQTIFKLPVFPYKLFSKLGLADNSDISSLISPNYFRRGTGVSLTVTDFATHNFIAFYAILLSFIKKKSFKTTLLFGLILIAVIKNNSLAFFVSIAFGLVVYFLKKNKVKIIGSILISGIGLFVIPVLLNYLMNVAYYGSAFYGTPLLSRLYVWDQSVGVFLKSPIWGVGIGNNLSMLKFAPSLMDINFTYTGIAIHSWFFDLLSGTGIIGLTFYSLFLLNMIFVPRKIVHIKEKMGIENRIDWIIYMSNISYVIFGLFNNPHYMNMDYYIMGGLTIYQFYQFKNEINDLEITNSKIPKAI